MFFVQLRLSCVYFTILTHKSVNAIVDTSKINAYILIYFADKVNIESEKQKKIDFLCCFDCIPGANCYNYFSKNMI